MFYRTRALQRFGGISLGKSKIGFLNSKTDFEFFQWKDYLKRSFLSIRVTRVLQRNQTEYLSIGSALLLMSHDPSVLFRKETHNPSPNLGLFERNPPLVFLFHECAAQIAPPVFTFKCNNWVAVSFGFQAKLNFVPSTFGASQFVCRVTKLFLHWSYASCKQGYIKVSTKSVQRRKRQSYLHMNVPKYRQIT